MTIMLEPMIEPLRVLRRLRSWQAWTLFCVALVSITAGVGLVLQRAGGDRGNFWFAVGSQCAIWGLIDLGFAVSGIVFCFRTASKPVTPQTEADEFAAGEKLLRALRYSHKFNVGYLAVAVVLLATAMTLRSPALLGHGVGVLLQGGFLFLFDLVYADRYARLMHVPV